MQVIHLITCEYPPTIGGVSEHSRVLTEAAVSAGFNVQVWTGDFSASGLARTDASLSAWPAQRRLIVQWVPHGYGRKGLNVAFSNWIRRRARAGDSIDLIVHEPFLDFFGGSWRQPFAALVQRYMTWTVLAAAERVWLTIPGWHGRLRPYGGRSLHAARTLPVPGTIPVVQDTASVKAIRGKLLNGRSRLVGYFGTGGRYAVDAIRMAVSEMAQRDTAFVCIGRGSDALSEYVRARVPDSSVAVSGTGALDRDQVSLHLQACDALLQPYPDGVSGRRTTTISALQHGVPVATTVGCLSEDFWTASAAVETVSVKSPSALGPAVLRLLDPGRNQAARAGAVHLYKTYFDPTRTMTALLFPNEQPVSC
jgi:glycosyltransferase involved in cell wall biosynthesis